LTVSELLRIADHLDPQGQQVVRKAYERAASAHTGQRRLSGEEYVNHPLEVAAILADLELDAETIAAALLHDTVEDTNLTAEEVQREFGPEVARLVDGVTKLGRIALRSDQQQQAENIRKMMVAMAEDLRVVLIKLADRLHNMRTLDPLPEPKRRKISRETLDIYAPLAHRLGIGQIRWELEDLAFRNLEPEAYDEVVKRIARQRHEREALVRDLREILGRELDKLGIQAEITGRPKHIYSVWQKMTRENKDFTEIYDLSAIRVQVETVRDVYGVLGVVHSLWKPMPGRFKDYVAMPKSNGYQSLHTTVITHTGEPIEIQIRTHEMHRVAEFGVAAHWTYKEGGKDGGSFDQKLSWLRSLLEWQNEVGDAESFLDTVKVDLFQDEVYVFTPRGDVINLPADSTLRLATTASGPRSTAAWSRSTTSSRTERSWRSLPPRDHTVRAGIGSTSSRALPPKSASASGSRASGGKRTWRRVTTCSTKSCTVCTGSVCRTCLKPSCSRSRACTSFRPSTTSWPPSDTATYRRMPSSCAWRSAWTRPARIFARSR
jgi:GTP pyrophosphokinase